MKIGFNCSAWDMLHAGHVTMLKKEKDMCDYLKVGLQVDPTIDRPGVKNKPVQSAYERYVQLQACKYIDEILIYETEQDLLNLIMTQNIHIRFLGDEYKRKDLWSVFNLVQEKLVGGMVEYSSGSKIRKARRIKNFQQDIKLNSELYELALEYAQ